MTIIEAQEILNGVEKLPMSDEQKDRLTSILEKVKGIRTDLDAASKKQGKKKGRHTVPNSSEYQISRAFEKHLEQLKTWSRLDSIEQWTKQLAHDIHIEEDRVDEYIDVCLTQAGGFAEGLRQNVCDIIADVTLDGESKQWIATVIGLIIDSVLLILYALFAFDVGPFRASQINDAVAGFIAAIVSVVTVAVTLIVCALINRHMIREYDKHHTIKYSELVRASKDRGLFKKSVVLMSFGGDFEEIKQRDNEIYQNTNELLKYSIASESLQKGISQKIGVLERQNRFLLEAAETTKKSLQQSLQNEEQLKRKVEGLEKQLSNAQESIMRQATTIATMTKRRDDEHESRSQRRYESMLDGMRGGFERLESIIPTLLQKGEIAKAVEYTDHAAKEGVAADQILASRWQIYCAALRSEYDDIIRGERGWFSKDVGGYREKFLSAAFECGVNISEDSIRALESRVKNVLKPDSELAKLEANRILDEFMRGIHCEDDKFQNALSVYVGDLRSGYDGILRDKLERFGNKEYLDGLLSVANEVGAKICREDFLDLQQRIIRVLRPESKPAKQQANKMLDEFINEYIKTKE